MKGLADFHRRPGEGAPPRLAARDVRPPGERNLRGLSSISSHLRFSNRLRKMPAAPASCAAGDVTQLRAELENMERESNALKAILELEEMKKMLISTGVPPEPREAWGAPPPAERATAAKPDALAASVAMAATAAASDAFVAAGDDELTAADEARLARLLASVDDDDDADDAAAADSDDADADEFAAQSPAEMAATLARMQAELAALQLQRDQQSQLLELEALRNQLLAAKAAESDAIESLAALRQ